MRKIYFSVILFFSLFTSINSYSQIVISQVYGGGGNTGATFKNDFIELFNAGISPVDISGWSVQYASSSGTSWSRTNLSSVILNPGQYYLIQEAQGLGGTVNLPTPDVTGTISLSGTAGKVALVNNSTNLSGSCPSSGIVDFVGFGGANCFEGSGPTATLSNSTAAIRLMNGCTDNNNNSTDFSITNPNPRNTSAPLNPCSGATPIVNFFLSSNTGSEANATVITLTAEASQAVVGDQTVTVNISGSGISNGDYILSNPTITILSGQIQGSATFTIQDDNVVEGLETATLSLSNPSAGITLGSNISRNISIIDNDIPSLSVAAGNNLGEPSTNGNFILTLTNPAPAGGTNVNYTLNGSASINEDYTDLQNGSIFIPEGSSTATIHLPVIDDNLYEPLETVSIHLTSAPGVFINTADAVINAIDDDPLPKIVINEVYGGGGNSGSFWKNDFIELYNTSNTPVNLTGLSVQYASAAGSSWQVTGLTGIIQGHGYYLIQEAAGAGGVLNLINPDQSASINMAASSGKVLLVNSIAAQSGTNPSGPQILDKVGYGSANGFETAAAADLSNSTSAQRITPGYDTDDNSSDFIVLEQPTPKNSDINPPAVTNLSPVNGATNVPVSFIASITFNQVMQKGAGNIILKSSTDNSIITSISISDPQVTVLGPTVSFFVQGLVFNTNYYFEITSGAFKDVSDNPFAGITGNSSWSFSTFAQPTGALGTIYDLNSCTGFMSDGFSFYSETGAQVWTCTPFGRDPLAPAGSTVYPNGIQMNGFDGTNIINRDWLISPSFDLTGTSFPLLSFWSRTAFNGLPLQLKVSTDYISGDPRSATWVDINGKFPGQTSNTWTLSDNINLSNFKQPNVHFAFIYNSSDDDGARWTLDDISLVNSQTPPPASLTVSTTDIQFNYVGVGSTAEKTFTFTGNDITDGVSLNASGDFQVSKDGSVFTPSISYTQSEANNITKTVYVRFSPSLNGQQTINGNINISTSSLSATVNLKGTSLDPASTLEVVNWNLEWFGSSSLGPTNDNQQQANVQSILQNIGADIYGVVEVVDENRLATVVSNMPGYSYTVGQFGSHVNPPEPGGGPLSDAQKLGFIYKTSVFSNVSAREMINAAPGSNSYNNWSSGRFPYMLTADVTLNCVTKRVHFVVVHAKANTSPTATAYARRQASATELHDTLMKYYANDLVIMLGDFNDDLDQSITSGFTTTSYSSFTTDGSNFFSPTLALSLAGKKSTVSYTDMIDHVMLTNDMQPYYMPGTANVLNDVSSLVTNYGSTTTDHYPVFTRYRFENESIPPIALCKLVSVTLVNGTASITAADVDNGSYDNCSTVSLSVNPSTFTCENVGNNNVTLTVTDEAGNEASCTAVVTVVGLPACTITAVPSNNIFTGGIPTNLYLGYGPQSLTLNSSVTGGSSFTYSWTGPNLSCTNCASPVFTPTSQGVYTLTLVATNQYGCSTTCSITVNVYDVRATGNNPNKIYVCHNGNTLSVSTNAVAAHLNHGDQLGTCGQSSLLTSTRITSTEETETTFLVTASPNPSNTDFRLQVTSDSQEPVTIRITDISGKTVKQFTTITNTMVKTGAELRSGIYFAEISQGFKKQTIKLLKTE